MFSQTTNAPCRAVAEKGGNQRKRRMQRRLSAHYLLSTIDDWNFNIFRMDALASGRSLFNIGLKMFQDHGLVEAFQLDIVKLMRCLGLIEEGYLTSNPYHNSLHAADVSQAMHCFLRQNKLSDQVTSQEKMAAILAALAHDVAHPGVSNSFLINTTNHLASLYNNESVLENHHWRTAASILYQTELLGHLDGTTQRQIDAQIKSLILATDITRQHELLQRFKNLSRNGTSLCNEENRHLALQIALKCADVSNAVRQWEVTRQWSNLVCQEFFQQGDSERKLGLSVAALNDRTRSTVAQIQTGFIEFIVQPLFSEWQLFDPTSQSDNMMSNIAHNLDEWRNIAASVQGTEETDESNMSTTSRQNPEDTWSTDTTSTDSYGPCRVNMSRRRIGPIKGWERMRRLSLPVAVNNLSHLYTSSRRSASLTATIGINKRRLSLYRGKMGEWKPGTKARSSCSTHSEGEGCREEQNMNSLADDSVSSINDNERISMSTTAQHTNNQNSLNRLNGLQKNELHATLTQRLLDNHCSINSDNLTNTTSNGDNYIMTDSTQSCDNSQPIRGENHTSIIPGSMDDNAIQFPSSKLTTRPTDDPTQFPSTRLITNPTNEQTKSYSSSSHYPDFARSQSIPNSLADDKDVSSIPELSTEERDRFLPCMNKHFDFVRRRCSAPSEQLKQMLIDNHWSERASLRKAMLEGRDEEGEGMEGISEAVDMEQLSAILQHRRHSSPFTGLTNGRVLRSRLQHVVRP